MKTTATQLLDAALHLPQPARAFLAERLLESLDVEPGFALSDKWIEEIANRCDQIDCGEVELLSEEQAFKQAFEALA
jgi:heat shock protein HspQ